MTAVAERKITYMYDYEVLPRDTTNAFVDMENRIIVTMHMTDDPAPHDYDAVQRELQAAFPDYTVRPVLMMNDPKTFKYYTDHFIGRRGRTEWFGWNSAKYDLMLTAAMEAYFQLTHSVPKPSSVRRWSNLIIEDGHKYPKSFFGSLSTSNEEFGELAQLLYRKCTASGMHVDVGALNEKGSDGAKGAQFMFPLKLIQSFTGLDVVEDDIIKGSEDICLTTAGLIKLLIYNINDVVSTGEIFKEPEYKGNLETRDTLRAEYTYLVKDRRHRDYLYQLPRDATSSKYAGKIIRGEQNAKLKDMPHITYNFPFPDGRWRNVLDYMETHEVNFSPSVTAFYRHFEGRDTTTQEQWEDAYLSSPTGKTTLNIPYVDAQGRATSAYNTVSGGGSHGGVVHDSHGRRENRREDRMWYQDFMGNKVSTVATVDVRNVIHVDFASYYPTMNILLGIYKTGLVDNYYNVRKLRYELKAMLTDELRASDPEKFDEINRRQDALKLILNGATGASNQHKENADLPLDNATVSMRIMGNLFIYALGQRFSNAGGLVISTNTDGLYVANMTMEEAKVVVDGFYKTYGLELEPEMIERMVNKSANERIEFHSFGPVIGGDLKGSLGDRIDLSKKIDYPRVSGKAVIRYITENPDWLLRPVDYMQVRRYIEEQLEDIHPIDWTITLRGSRVVKYMLEEDNYTFGEGHMMTKRRELQQTNRVILTTDGERIIKMDAETGAESKIPKFTSNKVRILNWRRELMDSDAYRDALDIEAYTRWAMNILANWHNPAVIPELDHVEKENTFQLTMDDLF